MKCITMLRHPQLKGDTKLWMMIPCPQLKGPLNLWTVNPYPELRGLLNFWIVWCGNGVRQSRERAENGHGRRMGPKRCPAHTRHANAPPPPGYPESTFGQHSFVPSFYTNQAQTHCARRV